MSYCRTPKFASGSPGNPIPLAEREQLRQLVARLGEAEAARQLELSRLAIARLLGGLGVRHATAELMRSRIRAIQATERAEAE